MERNNSRRSFGSRPQASSNFSRRPRGFSGGFRQNGGRHHRGFSRSGGGSVNPALYIKKAEPVAEAAPYKPTFRYSDLQVNSTLKQNILSKGYDQPTPIQDQSIPHILKGEDLLGLANTGTGKTAAFLIPLVHKIITNGQSKVIVLVPTRELAEQVHEELLSFTKNLQMYSVMCIGGVPIFRQLQNLKRRHNFVIGTPGRIKDLIQRRAMNLNSFDTIVLDEVDRMLDMGFVDEIKEIIRMLPEQKQSLFFSATLDNKIEGLMKNILKPNFVKISVVQGTTAKNVSQDVIYHSDYSDKIDKLKKLLGERKTERILLFVNTKREVDKLDKMLYGEGFSVTAIHGDKRQNWRKKAIERFKTGKSNVLIATDVAARGLDISGVHLVINYDIPNNHDDYVHRIGRTGRANAMGEALTFIKK